MSQITGYSTFSYADPHQRNIKVRITGPLWVEFTGDRWIIRTQWTSNSEKFPFDDVIMVKNVFVWAVLLPLPLHWSRCLFNIDRFYMTFVLLCIAFMKWLHDLGQLALPTFPNVEDISSRLHCSVSYVMETTFTAETQRIYILCRRIPHDSLNRRTTIVIIHWSDVVLSC